jgi:hypothetical protein
MALMALIVACRSPDSYSTDRIPGAAVAAPGVPSQRGTMAIARSGPPLPPSISIGSPMKRKSSAGRRSRSATSSKTGTFAAPRMRWLSNAVDWP